MPCLDLCVYFHAIWLDPSLHMLICLDSCSSMSMYKVPKYLHVCFDAYMSRSMFLHAYVLGSMFSTCFVLSFTCLCLDLGYVFRDMCYCSPFVALFFFLVFWPNGQDLI